MLKKIIAILFLLTTPTIYASEKITVLLDWFLNPIHAPLFVAQEKGYFKEQGLDVELIGPADPTDPPKLVAAGKADIAITYEPQFLQQVERGLPLVRIGSLVDHPMNCLSVLETSPIKSIKELKGKRVGNSMGSVESIMLKTMLEKNGLTLNDIESINVHYDLSQALLSKRVDAVTGMMRTFEPIQMELNNHPVRLFFPEENGVPSYEELIYVVNKQQANNPHWRQFLIAVQKGEIYLQQHPDEMWQRFAKLHPELNNPLNERAWKANLSYFSRNPFAINQNQWTIFIDYMKRNGLIQQKHSIDTYVVTIKV